MMNKEEAMKELTELRARADKLEEIINAPDEPEVKKLFPKDGDMWMLSANGATSYIPYGKSISSSALGNTFYTQEEAFEESARRMAEARVREAINLANKGDNGFKKGDANFELSYNSTKDKLVVTTCYLVVIVNSWAYFREKHEADKLLQDPQFVKDYKLALGFGK